MKLYALIAHVMEDSELLGVYSSKDAAESQKEICDSKGWDATVVVYEMNLGQYYEEGIARNNDRA
jgi:hypothetical protein